MGKNEFSLNNGNPVVDDEKLRRAISCADALTEHVRTSGRYTDDELAQYRNDVVDLHIGVFGAGARLAALSKKVEERHSLRDAVVFDRGMEQILQLFDDNIPAEDLN